MKTENRFEALDRSVAAPVVSCVKNGARFFLTEAGLASDIPARAAIFRHSSEANSVADYANTDYRWSGFDWKGGHLTAAGYCEPTT